MVPDEQDFADLDRRLPYHDAISSKSSPRYVRAFQRLAYFIDVPDRFSLVHYHASHFLRGTRHHLFEGPYLRWGNIPQIVSFSGSDARIISQARANNPYFHLAEDPARDNRTRKYLASISRNIRAVATDVEMVEYVAPYFDQVFIFRQPIDLSRIKAVAYNPDRPPVLLHVPTDPVVKGTEYIERAVEQLEAEGLVFEFRMRRRLTQAEFHRELADCDIYVDELRVGAYGVSSVEAMAIGKPAVTYVRPDLVEKYPAELPIVNANPDTITDTLRGLIQDRDRRAHLSQKSRAFVEAYHDAKLVATELLLAYRQIGLALDGSLGP